MVTKGGNNRDRIQEVKVREGKKGTARVAIQMVRFFMSLS